MKYDNLKSLKLLKNCLYDIIYTYNISISGGIKALKEDFSKLTRKSNTTYVIL